MRNILRAALALAVWAFSAQSFAANVYTDEINLNPVLMPLYQSERVAFGLDWHTSKGRTHELVFDNEHKVSELIWDIPYATMLDLKLNFPLTKSFAARLQASHLLDTGRGVMTDSDWDQPAYSYDNYMYSFSESRIELTTAKQYDAFLTYNLLNFQPRNPKSNELIGNTQDVKIDFETGYRFKEWRWRAIGGYGLYNELGVGREDDYFYTFSENETGIKYTHRIHMPLAGPHLTWRTDRLVFNFGALFTPFATSRDIDEHRLRNLVFKDNVDEMKYLELGSSLRYFVSKNFEANLGYTFEQLFEKRGSMDITQVGYDDIYHIEDSSGVSYSAHNYTAGFAYHF